MLLICESNYIVYFVARSVLHGGEIPQAGLSLRQPLPNTKSKKVIKKPMLFSFVWGGLKIGNWIVVKFRLIGVLSYKDSEQFREWTKTIFDCSVTKNYILHFFVKKYLTPTTRIPILYAWNFYNLLYNIHLVNDSGIYKYRINSLLPNHFCLRLIMSDKTLWFTIKLPF